MPRGLPGATEEKYKKSSVRKAYLQAEILIQDILNT
jgi:hypothetical protein